MNIERITASTASQASRIYALSWKSGYRGIVPQQYLDELSMENWTAKLCDPAYKDFLLKDNGTYVATSSVTAARDKTMQGWGEIVSLYVLPGYFRKGYGKILFSHVADQLYKDGFLQIYLWVLEENHRARTFYETMGFMPNGDRTILNIGGKELTELRYINFPEHFNL